VKARSPMMWVTFFASHPSIALLRKSRFAGLGRQCRSYRCWSTIALSSSSFSESLSRPCDPLMFATSTMA